MTSLHMIDPESNTPIAASDGQTPQFFIIDTKNRSKREIKPVFSEFYKAFEMFLTSRNKMKSESDLSKTDKDGIKTKKTQTTAQGAEHIKPTDAEQDIAEGPALEKTQGESTTEREYDESGKEAKTPSGNIEPTTEALSANAKSNADALSDPIKPVAEVVLDDNKSMADVIAEDTKSIAKSPSDDIEPLSDTGSGETLPVVIGLGVAAGGAASIYYAYKKKIVQMAIRLGDGIPMLVRSPEALLDRGINMDIQEVGIAQLNEALSALAFELASALDNVSEVIDNTDNTDYAENAEVAANTENADNIENAAVTANSGNTGNTGNTCNTCNTGNTGNIANTGNTANTAIGGASRPRIKTKTKITLSSSAA